MILVSDGTCNGEPFEFEFGHGLMRMNFDTRFPTFSSLPWLFLLLGCLVTQPNGKELLMGILIPRLGSKTIRQAVSVLGCVIMPHNVFLHSTLVQSRKIDPYKKGREHKALNYYSIESTAALLISFMINLFVTTVFAKGFHGTQQANSIGLVSAGQYLEEKYGAG